MKYDHWLKRKQPLIARICWHWYHKRIAKEILMNTTPDASILEIGPGDGSLGMLLKDDREYFAIEQSEANFKHCGSLGLNVAFGVGPICMDKKIADCVVASQVLEHTGTCNDACGFLTACHNALTTNGILVLGVPDALSMKIGFWNQDYTHNFLTTSCNCKNILIDSGFTNIKMKYIYGGLTGFIGLAANIFIRATGWLAAIAVSLNANWCLLDRYRTLFARNILITAIKEG
jgi:hypothetical protein